MASRGNAFAVLRGYRGDEEETILARAKATEAAAKEKRRTVDNWVRDTQKPFAAAAYPERFVGERGRYERNTGPERHNRGGQWSSSNRGFSGLEHYEEGQDISYNRGVKIDSGRSNAGGNRNDTYYNQPRRDFKAEDKRHQEIEGASDDSDGIVEKLGPVSKDERKDYRIKNWNSGGYRGYHRRQGKYRNPRGIVEKWVPVYREEKEYGIEGSSSAAYRRGGGDEELQKDIGDAEGGYGDVAAVGASMKPEPNKEKQAKELGQVFDELIATTKRYKFGDVAVGASMEPEPNKEKQAKELSQEEAERLAQMELEAKRMTLKEYEEQNQERRKALESVKMEERKVTPDKEFESMQIVGKKSKEESTSAVKNNTDRDKKKKAAMDSYDDQAHKRIIPGFRHYRARYSDKQSGRSYIGYSSRTRADLPPAIQDETQFPALGGSRNA